MKKIALFFLVAIIATFLSCNQPTSVKISSSDPKAFKFEVINHYDSSTNKYTAKPTIVISFGEYNKPNVYPNLNIRTVDSVQKAINNLATSGLNMNVPNSFVFNASDLKKYLDASQSPTIQLILASDTQNNHLFLTIMPIDINSDHMYLINTTTNVPYIAVSMNPPPALQPTISDVSTPYIRDFYFGAATVTSANGWILAYTPAWVQTYNTSVQNKVSAMWLYDSYELSRYIAGGLKGNMVYIEFKLCDINNQLCLIADGVNNLNQHMGFVFQQVPCVLENFNPCPYCLVNPLESN